jgi:glutamyl-Q tRNA(Asp) synthetase
MIVTRFAPSPTGRLHLGHAFSALLAHSRARESGGRFLLRIEDLDQGRTRPEFVEGIFEDLRWLGLGWDEPVLVQSQRTKAYGDALGHLREAALAYACYCTRADIAQSLTAPHGDAASSYPGTCRALPDDPERRAATPHCWRLQSARALELTGIPSWTEADGTLFEARPSQIGDAILARKDAHPITSPASWTMRTAA